MTIPFRVKLLTNTAKVPERANEGDLFDLFADSFDHSFLKDIDLMEDECGTYEEIVTSTDLANVTGCEQFDSFKLNHAYDYEDGKIKSVELYPQGRILVKTGIAIELPIKYSAPKGLNAPLDQRQNIWTYDYGTAFLRDNIVGYAVADIRPRSGLALKRGVTVLNTPGTIDNSYRKEIGVILYNAGHESYTINKGDKIAQMLIRPLYLSNFEIVEDFEDTGRGGFGSTGK